MQEYDGASVSPEALARFEEVRLEKVRAVRQTENGQRLIVYHTDGSASMWDIATTRFLCRSYRFRNGSRWLTVMADGRCYGNLEFVRYR